MMKKLNNDIGIFLDPLTDFGFKYLFTQERSKPFLIHFLNSLLKTHQLEIKDLVIENTEHTARSAIHKTAIFDLYCTTIAGEQIVIEVQRIKQESLFDRLLFYVSHLVVKQPKNKDWNYEINPVYVICIMDFCLIDKVGAKVVNTFSFRNETVPELTYSKFKFLFIQMPLFKESINEIEHNLDIWLYLFRNLAKLKKQPKKLDKTIYSAFIELAKTAKLSEGEMELYDRELSIYRDEYSRRQTALNDGRKEGLKEGLDIGFKHGVEKGIKQGKNEGYFQAKIEIIQRLYKQGFNVAEIVNLVELEQNEVERIIADLNQL